MASASGVEELETGPAREVLGPHSPSELDGGVAPFGLGHDEGGVVGVSDSHHRGGLLSALACDQEVAVAVGAHGEIGASRHPCPYPVEDPPFLARCGGDRGQLFEPAT